MTGINREAQVAMLAPHKIRQYQDEWKIICNVHLLQEINKNTHETK